MSQMRYRRLTWGRRRSSVASQSIFDVTALEILPTSELQIVGQTLPNDGFQQCWAFQRCYVQKKSRTRHAQFCFIIQSLLNPHNFKLRSMGLWKQEGEPFLMWWRWNLETLYAFVLRMRTWGSGEAHLRMHRGPFPLFFFFLGGVGSFKLFPLQNEKTCLNSLLWEELKLLWAPSCFLKSDAGSQSFSVAHFSDSVNKTWWSHGCA